MLTLTAIYSFKIYLSINLLPPGWDEIANGNIFLTSDYLDVLLTSGPKNMQCYFIGLFENEALVGVALSQFLDSNQLESFGERDRCMKKTIRNFIFRNFSSHVLFIGNNMLTGQNAFVFAGHVNTTEALATLLLAASEIESLLKKQGKKIHLITFKDFDATVMARFPEENFKEYYRFSTQPNMVFTINEQWKSEQDYITALSKKYRNQYTRARKKMEGIVKRKMHLEDILAQEKEIYALYSHVARNAPFNTFFLSENHFSIFKEKLGDKFLFYGYFLDEKIIGFNTLIKNGNAMETYFLGYDEMIQKEKMLYLNMLYDMVAYSINKGFKEIIFARTALEIKSAVGAEPVEVFGYIRHTNTMINKKMPAIFDFLEPKTVWQERNPFK